MKLILNVGLARNDGRPDNGLLRTVAVLNQCGFLIEHADVQMSETEQTLVAEVRVIRPATVDFDLYTAASRLAQDCIAAAYHIPTACTGHTGPEVRMGQVYTKEQCYALLTADEKKAMDAVLRNTTGDINPNELAALTDFTLNVGEGNLKSSTLLKLWNQGNHAAACRELPRWVYAKGVKLVGLVTRRAKEMALCLLPTK